MKKFGILLLFFVGILGVFGYELYQSQRLEKQIQGINDILNVNLTSREVCEKIFDINAARLFEDELFTRQADFTKLKENCNKKYNIINAEKTQKFCERVIQGKNRTS